MDVLEAFSQSRQEFETRLRQVGADQWDLSTPCPDWSVRDLVNHMLLGTRMAVQLLAGASRDEVMAGLGDDLITDDPVGDFVALADQMEAAFAAPGGLDGTVAHPMGDIPRQMFLGFRMTDNAVHGWDLARAIGVDDQFNEELAEQMLENAKPNAAMFAGSGVFGDGASGNVDDDASNQTKLLDLLGRRP